MTQPVFYTPEIQTSHQLPDEEANHCVRVLRMTEGDEILLTDGSGFFYKAILSNARAKSCRFEIIEKQQAPLAWRNRIHIAVAPTKNIDRMEWFAEKATEIGINEISLINCRFSERKEIKLPRLEKVLIAAMKQSQKAVLPCLNEMQQFHHFINRPLSGQKFIAHCHPGEKPLLKDVYRPGEDVTILVGPEGDFSEEEVADALKNGYLPVSLGESRLRTETAALAACHTIHVLG